MAKVKTKVKFDITSALDSFMDKKTAQALGETVDTAVQDLLSKGLSPVRGERRLEKYKNEDRYPGNLKPKRPVNLYLSGEMRSWLKHKQKDRLTVTYGFLEGTPRDVLARADRHQHGSPSTAARPMIPETGQEWAVSIVRAIKEVVSTRLQAIIKKSNR